MRKPSDPLHPAQIKKLGEKRIADTWTSAKEKNVYVIGFVEGAAYAIAQIKKGKSQP